LLDLLGFCPYFYFLFKRRRKKNVFDEKEIKRFRHKLLEEKRRIVKGLQEQKREEERLGEDWMEPKDLEDWANISLSEDLKLKLADRDISLLRDIDRALKRLDRGEYGTCIRCGKEIEVERLEILPWTPYCAECAKKVSK